MQKVEGSSPFIRLTESPAQAKFFQPIAKPLRAWPLCPPGGSFSSRLLSVDVSE
jgi:hypothetical protein